jgi:hypothetical protein
MSISGIRDLDREILGKLDDRDLLKACLINKYTWNTVCDDLFLKRRLLGKFPKIEQYKSENETWKYFFLRAVHCIALMKVKYGYDYTFGNFEKQFKILLQFNKNKSKLLIRAAWKGDLALVIWSLEKGANIQIISNLPLRNASECGHFEVVKYLVENGADIHDLHDLPLINASYEGHLEIVRYLVEHGADIHALNEQALRWASRGGRSEIVKYLLEQGSDIQK